jgi:hypothetical protein
MRIVRGNGRPGIKTVTWTAEFAEAYSPTE